MAKPKIKSTRPNRDPDHYSKRNVPYWWSPEFVRGTSADNRDHEWTKTAIEDGNIDQSDVLVDSSGSFVRPCDNYGRIHAVKEKNTVNLYMKSKNGNLTYIQGSIQDEFKRWHEDRSIDYLLFGLDPDEIIASED